MIMVRSSTPERRHPKVCGGHGVGVEGQFWRRQRRGCTPEERDVSDLVRSQAKVESTARPEHAERERR